MNIFFGRMRESLSGIKRADVVIITKCKDLTCEQKAWCRDYIKKLNMAIEYAYDEVK